MSEINRLDASAIRAQYQANEEAPAPRETQAAPQFNTGVRKATEPQIKFFRDLVAKHYPTASDEYVQSVIDQGFARVSQAIDKLKAMPVVAPQTKREALEFIPRVNKYGGKCDLCGARVEEMEGILSKSDDDKWVVSHKVGQCPANEFPFPLGRYAVPTEEGHLGFYHATIEGLYVQASDILHRVPANAQNSIIEKIAADPEEASRTYGRELGQCGVCGRVLTDEISRAQGIGPVCSGRTQFLPTVMPWTDEEYESLISEEE